MHRAPSAAPPRVGLRGEGDPRDGHDDGDGAGEDDKRGRQMRKTAALFTTVLSALVAAGALDELPPQEKSVSAAVGGLMLVRDVATYYALAAAAQRNKIARYGNVVLSSKLLPTPTLSYPGGALMKVDPTPTATLIHVHDSLGDAQTAGVTLNAFRVGKCSVYAEGSVEWKNRPPRALTKPGDFFTWDADTIRRFQDHATAELGFAITIVVAIFTSEKNALAAEQYTGLHGKPAFRDHAAN
jgi:hypothetical protein